jgi:hypothetical protein
MIEFPYQQPYPMGGTDGDPEPRGILKYEPCPSPLEILADDCLFKKYQFEKALRELITHHRILILAIERSGIRIGKGK